MTSTFLKTMYNVDGLIPSEQFDRTLLYNTSLLSGRWNIWWCGWQRRKSNSKWFKFSTTIPGWSIRVPRQHQNNYYIKCLCLDLEKQERWSNKWPVVLPVPPRDPAPPHKSPFVLRRHQNLLFAPASCRAPRPEGWWRWAVKERQSRIVQFTAKLSLLSLGLSVVLTKNGEENGHVLFTPSEVTD